MDIDGEAERLASARVRELATSGSAVKVAPTVPCHRYYRTGLEMLRIADMYLNSGNLEQAYIFYNKYMTLFIEKIRKHPEYPSIPISTKNENQANLKTILPKAEKIKKQLLELYTEENKKMIIERNIKLKQEEERARQQKTLEEQDEKLAETLQADELRKFNNRKPAEPNAPSAPPLWTNVSQSNVQDVLYPDDFATEPNRVPPGHQDHIPPIVRQNKPNIPVDTKTSYSDGSSDSLLGGGSAFRTIIVPSVIMDKFLNLAATNTKLNIETCGVLAGKLERNNFLLTHVIVPQQNGTPDSCTTKNEEEIFYFQDQNNLITLGWIHTHPTQTAFLSSVDLHTQCSYQLMMPEAIAIVCAPKYHETGFFGLTPHYGMSFIANCRKTGFHPHPSDPPLFKNVTHIKLDEQATLQVIDLRK